MGSASHLAESDQVGLQTLAAFSLITLITSALIPSGIPSGEGSSSVSDGVHDDKNFDKSLAKFNFLQQFFGCPYSRRMRAKYSPRR